MNSTKAMNRCGRKYAADMFERVIARRVAMYGCCQGLKPEAKEEYEEPPPQKLYQACDFAVHASGTGLGSGAIKLRAVYALPGTDLRYGATTRLRRGKPRRGD
eukprot:3364786-Rhodomonas_salina.2